MRSKLFVGIDLVKTPDNAVYGVLEMCRHRLRLKDRFDVVKCRWVIGYSSGMTDLSSHVSGILATHTLEVPTSHCGGHGLSHGWPIAICSHAKATAVVHAKIGSIVH